MRNVVSSRLFTVSRAGFTAKVMAASASGVASTPSIFVTRSPGCRAAAAPGVRWAMSSTTSPSPGTACQVTPAAVTGGGRDTAAASRFKRRNPWRPSTSNRLASASAASAVAGSIRRLRSAATNTSPATSPRAAPGESGATSRTTSPVEPQRIPACSRTLGVRADSVIPRRGRTAVLSVRTDQPGG